MARVTAVFALLFVAACKTGGDSGEDPDETDDTEDTNNPTGIEPGELAEEFGIEDEGNCETFAGYEHDGATRFYVGAFGIDGEDVDGFEALVLFPNDTLEANTAAGWPMPDCEVWYSVIGTKGDATMGAADYSISIHGTLDRQSSSCPEDYVNFQDTNYDVTYNVVIDGGGDAQFFFESGNPLGEGSGSDSEIRYASASACEAY